MTREQWHKYLDDVLDDAEKSGRVLAVLKVHIGGVAMKLGFLTSKLEVPINPESFKPEYRTNADVLRDAGYYGVLMSLPKDVLAGGEG